MPTGAFASAITCSQQACAPAAQARLHGSSNRCARLPGAWAALQRGHRASAVIVQACNPHAPLPSSHLPLCPLPVSKSWCSACLHADCSWARRGGSRTPGGHHRPRFSILRRIAYRTPPNRVGAAPCRHSRLVGGLRVQCVPAAVGARSARGTAGTARAMVRALCPSALSAQRHWQRLTMGSSPWAGYGQGHHEQEGSTLHAPKAASMRTHACGSPAAGAASHAYPSWGRGTEASSGARRNGARRNRHLSHPPLTLPPHRSARLGVR